MLNYILHPHPENTRPYDRISILHSNSSSPCMYIFNLFTAGNGRCRCQVFTIAVQVSWQRTKSMKLTSYIVRMRWSVVWGKASFYKLILLHTCIKRPSRHPIISVLSDIASCLPPHYVLWINIMCIMLPSLHTYDITG